MTLPNGSASASDRTFACAASLALPRSERGVDEDRDRGIEGHGFITNVLHGTSCEDALKGLPAELRKTCEALDWRALVGDLEPGTVENEAAFAVDVRAHTSRRLGHGLARGYEAAAKSLGRKLGAWEVPGTLDITGRSRGGRRRILTDVKFGWEDVTPAAHNGQLLLLASALYLLEGADEIEARIAKVKPDGSIRYRADQIAVFTPLDLEIFLDRYESRLVAVKAARALVKKRRLPEVTTGPWCKYCDAANACPGKMRIVREMFPDLALIGERVQAMTRDEIRRAWLKWKQIEPLAEQVGKALDEAIMRETAENPDGLDLENGKNAKAITYPRTDASAKRALALAQELGATDEQIAECFHTKVITTVREVNTPKKRKGRAA